MRYLPVRSDSAARAGFFIQELLPAAGALQ
jgi:hypothetical protein